MNPYDESSRWSMVTGRDVPWLLGQWAERTPDKPFLIWEPFSGDRVSFTYQQFHLGVERVAAALHRRGVEQGDHVLIHMENCAEFLFSWFACARIGAIAVSTMLGGGPRGR